MQNIQDDFYNKNANDFYSRTIKLDMQSEYSRFLPLVKPGGRVLDAGCGSGRDARIFKDLGFKVSAFDASVELAKRASALLGEPVEHATFDSITLMGKYDGIWACASLLHVPEAKLPKTLRKLANALSDDGVIFASFKLGSGTRFDGEREFTDMNLPRLELILNQVPELEVYDLANSVAPDSSNDGTVWFSPILKKRKLN